MPEVFRINPPTIIGPSIHRLGGLTLSELHDYTGLPACFIEELLQNDFRPPTDWAASLEWFQTHKQVIHVFEKVETIAPRNATAYVCYHTAVQFYRPDPFENIDMVRLTPRTWPNISFVERAGELREITGGRVFWDEDHAAWRWQHSCYRNTELARHFRGACQRPDPGWVPAHCVPCRQIEAIREYGHGNYGLCERCGGRFALVPDHKLGPVLPRHECSQGVGGGWWPDKILEPMEAVSA